MKYVLILGGVLVVIIAVVIVVADRDSAKQSIPDDKERESLEEESDSNPVITPSSERLDLSGKGLTRVPDDVFQQTNLVVLDISNNTLSGSLQAEVRHLKSLRELDMSNNQFTGVPAEIGQLSELEILNLSDNPITGLPLELGNLANLKILDLRGTNYAKQDLDTIRTTLPTSVEIRVD